MSKSRNSEYRKVLLRPRSLVLMSFALFFLFSGLETVAADYRDGLAAAVITDDPSIGTRVWLTPDNAKFSDNMWVLGVHSPATPQTFYEVTHYLKLTDFGLAIPDTAVITGVEAWIERRSNTGTPYVYDNDVRLVVNNVITGNNKADPAAWTFSGSDLIVKYGSAVDMWGAASLTPAIVNSPSFGIAVSVKLSGQVKIAMVDHIKIRVHYTLPPQTGQTLSCDIRDDASGSPCPELNSVFRIWDDGSHATSDIRNRQILPYDIYSAHPGEYAADYNLVACCEGVARDPELPNDGGTVLRIFDPSLPSVKASGAHAAQNDYDGAGYGPVNFGSAVSNVQCGNFVGEVTADGCPLNEGYDCVAKLYKESDSHVASCDTTDPDATIAVCCRQGVDIPGWIIQGSPRPIVSLPEYDAFIPSPQSIYPESQFGSSAVRITISDPSDYGGIRTIDIPVEGNTEYEASVYVYVPVSAALTGTWELHRQVQLSGIGTNHEYTILNTDANDYYITEANMAGKKGQWIRKNVRFRTNPGAAVAKIFLITSPSGTGDIYADGFNLVKIQGNKNPEDPLPFLKSDFNFGCCQATECWDGSACVNVLSGDDYRNTHSSEPFPVCLAEDQNADKVFDWTNWSIPFLKKHWYNTTPDADEWQYCPTQGQCWQSYTDASSGTLLEGCYFMGEISNDKYCLASPRPDNWESRTKYLLANMLELGEELGYADFTVVCDSADCFAKNAAGTCPIDKEITCVYRNAETNTIIAGVLLNKSLNANPSLGNELMLPGDPQDFIVSEFMDEILGVGYNNDNNGPPRRTRRDFTPRTDAGGYHNAQNLNTRHRIKSIGYNNITRIILISNAPIDYRTRLDRGMDTSYVEKYTQDFQDYYNDGSPVGLPAELSSGGAATYDLEPLVAQPKFYDTIFIQKSGAKRITALLEKHLDKSYFLGAFYRNVGSANDLCPVLAAEYSVRSFEYDLPPKPLDYTRWFNCLENYAVPEDRDVDMFAILNTAPPAETPVWETSPAVPPAAYFAMYFWNETLGGFRNFANCSFKYDFNNLTVPWEYSAMLETEAHLPFGTSSPDGCCPSDKCWNGRKCVGGWNSDVTNFTQDEFIGAGSRPESLFSPYDQGRAETYVCRLNATVTYPNVGLPTGEYVQLYSDWSKVYRKDAYDLSEYGYCLEQNKCWITARGTSPAGCVATGAVQGKYYCLSGEWTTLTHLAAITLLNVTEKAYGADANFTFACNNMSNVSRIMKLYHGTATPVCTYYNLGNRQITFAFSPPGALDDPAFSIHTMIEGDLKIIMANFPNACDSAAGKGLADCEIDASYAGRARKVMWDFETGILVVSTDDAITAPGQPTGFAKRMWNWFIGLLGFRERGDAPALSGLRSMISKTRNFENFFYRQDNRTVDLTGNPTYIEALSEQTNQTTKTGSGVTEITTKGYEYASIIYRNLLSDNICTITDATAGQLSSASAGVRGAVYNCGQTIHFPEVGKMLSYYDYAIFVANNDLGPIAEQASLDIGKGFWQDQTRRFENYSACAYAPDYHDAYLPMSLHEEIKVEEYLLYNSSTMSSCCKGVDSCWTGNNCTNEFDLLNRSLPLPGFERLWICQAGNWQNAVKRYDWSDLTYDYCAGAGQCFLPRSRYEAERKAQYDYDYDTFSSIYLDGRGCTNGNFRYFYDHACNNGNWTTRTGLIAAKMLNFTAEQKIVDYSIYCDSYENTLNYIDYDVEFDAGTPKSLHDYLSGVGSPRNIAPTNNFCVLQYNDTNDNNRFKVAVGTSINNVSNASDYLKSTVGRNFAGVCDGKGAEGFDNCDAARKVWYDNNYEMIIYNNVGMDLGAPTRLEAFLGFLTSPVKTVINWVRGLFISSANVPTDVFVFDKFYTIHVGDKTIVGRVRDKQGTPDEDKYVVVSYDNLTTYVCNSIERYNMSSQGQGTLVCDGYYLATGTDFDIMQEAWPDMTARLRLQARPGARVNSMSAIPGITTTINWNTDELSTGSIRYGKAVGIWEGTIASASGTSKVHSATLVALEPGTEYYFMIVACKTSIACSNYGPYRFGVPLS
ncbi:fibronectin type III domain-containing protein [Candidatus Woesearchaeota archaeon]|nr:fibronectin type III domain-containing protein [Candidatus Woesearchaeota archaeon]